MKRSSYGLLVLILVTAFSCTFYGAIKPVDPPASNVTVSSLQPTFQWKYEGEEGEAADYTYDLVIHEVMVDPNNSTKKLVGDVVYYRENIEGTEHALEEPLKPETEYCWSVRLRKDDKVGGWARYNQATFIGVATVTKKNALFRFRTPKAKE